MRLPVASGEEIFGNVRKVLHADGKLAVSGELVDGEPGTFAVTFNRDEVSAVIQWPRRGVAFTIDDPKAPAPVLREVLRSEIICTPMPLPEFADAGPPPAPAEEPMNIPILSSRPSATAVLYMDFDGEVVSDPLWNGGVTINAAPSGMSDAAITEVWQRVAEDFAPFHIDVTTNVARYNAAPVGRRMRCIISPTNTAAPGAGGVAYVNSFSRAGTGSFRANIPCWGFIVNDAKACAEVISHEFGHTLGLYHDGRFSPREEYYQGHGVGATGWAPIMGVGYYRSLVQWSKGEYASANNQEDDLAIIARSQNGFGYLLDEAGDTREASALLGFSGENIAQQGVITQAADSDYFLFSTTGGAVTINANGAAPSPNLDVLLELEDSTGTVLATANPAGGLDASISRTVAAGDYFIKVRGTGLGNPLGTGYTAYASIGGYTLSGTIPGGTSSPVPVITSPAGLPGLRGVALAYQITATSLPTSFALAGTLPAGVNFDASTGLISGTPTNSGTFPVQISATNAFGTGSKALTITVTRGAVPLGVALDAPEYPWVSGGDDEWLGQVSVTFDGVDAAESGEITHDQVSWFESVVTGPCVVRFRWQVDSEPENDYLALLVDGTERERISGQAGWSSRSFTLTPGQHTIRFEYRKNASISSGLDRAWVDTVQISFLPQPVITSAGSVIGEEDEVFFYRIEADNQPTSFGVVGDLPSGLVVDAATGVISGIPLAPAEVTVQITATNDAGTSSKPLAITITPPILRLAESVDAEEFPWSTGGNAQWFPQEVISFDGLHSAQSGKINHRQNTWIEASVIGPVAVRFRWKVSSEKDYDVLAFSIDGRRVAAVSGEVDWEERIVAVPAGLRKLRWEYIKDASISAGEDTAWLDRFSLDTTPLLITPQVVSGRVGTLFSFQIGAVNTPTLYEASGLPPGLAVNPETGNISGTPLAQGEYLVSLRVVAVSGEQTGSVLMRIFPATSGGDLFADATNLEGAWVKLAANSSTASKEPGEPNHAGKPGGKSLWWNWTAPSSGQVRVSTAGSAFDTVLAVYQGSEVSALLLVAQNDNAGGARTSGVRFKAEAGTTYRIAVDGASAVGGSIALSIAYERPASYVGLLQDENTGVSAGSVRLSVTRDQHFTGRVQFGKFRYGFKGKIITNQSEIFVLRSKKAPTVPLVLQADALFGTNVIEGQLNAASQNYRFSALRSMAAEDLPAGAVGPYSTLILRDAVGPGLPGGTGFARTSLAKNAQFRFVGVLGDGQKFSAATPILLDGRAPIFVTPYRGDGAFGGWLPIDFNGGPAKFAARLDWKRAPDAASPLYPAGFEKTATLTGERYLAPAGGTKILAFDSGLVMLENGDLNFSPREQTFTLSPTNKALFSPLVPGFTLRIDPKSGYFRGAFQAGAGGAKRTFGGMLMRSEDAGQGLFNGLRETGNVWLGPAE